MKIRNDDVILRYMTSSSYIFPYYDGIDKTADVSKNTTRDLIFSHNVNILIKLHNRAKYEVFSVNSSQDIGGSCTPTPG